MSVKESAVSDKNPGQRREEPPAERVSIAGLHFHNISFTNAVRYIDFLISKKESHQICLANAFTVAFCRRIPQLRNLINQSTLVLADGMSIVWGGRWQAIKLPERVAGPDLMEALCKLSDTKGYRIYLMGSSSENLKLLTKALLSQFPNLQICGTHSPSISENFSEEETLHILKLVGEAKPDILFVGVSAPKQEIWIAQNLSRIPVPVSIGVGAAFDFISGRIPRAPERMRRLGLEWLYRLSREPKRLWKRYLLGNAVFLSVLIKEIIIHKFLVLKQMILGRKGNH